MADYTALYQKIAQEIIDHEGKLTVGTLAFVRTLIAKLKAEGWQLDSEAEQAITDYTQTMQDSIKTGIQRALATTVSTTTGSTITHAMQSSTVLRLQKQAFNTRWADDLTLSKRLWIWRDGVKHEVLSALAQHVKTSAAINKTLYQMQYAIEHNSGNRFDVVSTHKVKWVKQLADAAKAMIHDPQAKTQWDNQLIEVQDYIDKLTVTGTRRDAERLLSQIKKAVEKGSEELVDSAVKWKVYDKQLYNLKRIARTEMATAAHRAVIASSIDDPDIIGYQWRLSGGHPSADICDYYANIELGLGKGVFPKDSVPRTKAHPHCMCLLIPRITPIKQRGSENYSQFLERLPPEKQVEIMPQWVRAAMDDGVPLQDLVRKDGLGLKTKQDARQPLFKAWANKVTQPNYKARHEFQQVGTLPSHIMVDKEVAALSPLSDVIHVSDYQLRHALREAKNSRNAALTVAEISALPNHLEKARWFYDGEHQNIVAAFELGGGKLGKAAIAINFHRGKADYNAVMTTGLIKRLNLGHPNLREITSKA